MSAVEPAVFSEAENARDAAKWRELQGKVKECLDDSSNGYASIWGGDDNLHVSVIYQSRGYSGMKLTLTWSSENEFREDLDSATTGKAEND
jgi:hypothetical protein